MLVDKSDLIVQYIGANPYRPESNMRCLSSPASLSGH